jgi:hypothetical protein
VPGGAKFHRGENRTVTRAKNPPLPPAAPLKAPPPAAAARVDDLGFNFASAASWFPHAQAAPYLLIRVSDAHAKAWAAALGVTVRRCYITDDLIDERATATGRPKSEIVAAVLPDAGSTMSGDFGEILVYLYQSAKEQPGCASGPKKWRLKQDRKKPAPYSDVVQFILPDWPKSSARDAILCSEVKAKALQGATQPIAAAMADSAKDRTSRLAKTIAWLKDRALTGDTSGAPLAEIERFAQAIDHPPAAKRFGAVAVVCKSLVDAELAAGAPTQAPVGYSVVVISVPELKKTYSAVYDAAQKTVAAPPSAKAKTK